MQPCALNRFPGIYFFYRITGLLFVCIFGTMVSRVLFHPVLRAALGGMPAHVWLTERNRQIPAFLRATKRANLLSPF